MGGAGCPDADSARQVGRSAGMQVIGKGKGVRPGRPGAFSSAAFGANAFSVGRPDEEVYLAPGMPGGVSAAELKALSVPLQMLVMEAWFRANFHAAPYGPSGDATDPALELAGEFGGVAQGQAIEQLGRTLAGEASAWVTETGLDRIAAEARLGIVIASADPRFRRPDTAEAAVLARLDAAEKALAKLQSPHGGIGHNNPPDGPLTPEEQVDASAAVAELREEAAATRPDPSRAQRAAQVLAKVAATVGRWIWKRAEMGIDEAIKKAAGAGGIFTAADAMDAWQKLNALVEAVGRWISVLGS